ncbi:MAG: MBL fold metallo-hydrolase [Bacteroidota bacterium]
MPSSSYDLKINFENVGQGDALVLEWPGKDNQTKIGIIDCNIIPDQKCPVQECLDQLNIREIEFIILSHPHSDHFSGLLNLLTYCIENNIRIKRFYHTAAYSREFMTSLTVDEETFAQLISASVNTWKLKKELSRLFLKLDELHKGNSILDRANLLDYEKRIQVNEQIGIKVLSPYYYEESKKYISAVFRPDPKDTSKENNPKANLLSTVLEITHKEDDWSVLLTSDASKASFRRISKEVNVSKLIFAQIPHHGSKYNHDAEFWLSIPHKSEIPVVMSVGRRYGHPHKEVVEFFQENFKEVHATNYVGGFQAYFEEGDSFLRRVLADIPSIHRSSPSPHPKCGRKSVIIRSGGKVEILTEDYPWD